MPLVEFICLANSTKHGEHCVAGIRTDGQGWIRPVGARRDGALTASEIICDDGFLPKVLDVLSVDLATPAPQCHQPENWTCSRGAQRWRRTRMANAADLLTLERHLESGPAVLGSTTKEVDFTSVQNRPVEASLALIEPQELNWQVKRWKEDEPLHCEAVFVLARQRYWLSVTDPPWKGRMLRLGEGLYPSSKLGPAMASPRILLTISLGEPFSRDGRPNQCWKMVAGVVAVAHDDRQGRLDLQHLSTTRASAQAMETPKSVAEPQKADRAPEEHPPHRAPWTILEDRKLKSLLQLGSASTRSVEAELGRTNEDVQQRLRELGLR